MKLTAILSAATIAYSQWSVNEKQWHLPLTLLLKIQLVILIQEISGAKIGGHCSYKISFKKNKSMQVRNKGGGPGGLDSCPFHQKFPFG